MHAMRGGCHCGAIRIELELTRPPGSYNPRACDCDFCRKHGAAWVSDLQGSLCIRIVDPRHRGSYRQGSGQADLVVCRSCGVLIGALHEEGGRVYGTVNVNALEGAAQFGPEQPVSPKSLGPVDKSQRWKSLWFADVRVEGDTEVEPGRRPGQGLPV